MKVFILIVIALFIPNIFLAKRELRGDEAKKKKMKDCNWKFFGSECEEGWVCAKREDYKGQNVYKCRGEKRSSCEFHYECKEGLECRWIYCDKPINPKDYE